jgi:signal transduction histidine kinase
VPKSRQFASDSAEILNPSFLKQVRSLQGHLPRLNAAIRPYKKKLRQLGFDQAQSELLIRITPGAALAAGTTGRELAAFFRDVETAGQQLAKWNVRPDRTAAALKDYTKIAAGRTPGDCPALLSVLSELYLAIILRINSAYLTFSETEIRAVFELCRANVNSPDGSRLLRSFLESLAALFGASAAHVFLLDDEQNSWRLKASTALAVSPEAKAMVPVTAAVKSKLRRPFDAPLGRTRPPMLLDPGWNRKWRHFWSVPMFVRGGFRGALQLTFSDQRQLLPRDIELLSLAGEQSLAAAEYSQLIEDIAVREQRMFDLARRMLQVEEIERRRISRELHDDAAQSLAVVRLQMEMIELSMPPDAEWRERLAEARDITEATILHVRRLIADLSPAVMEQLGLAAGLRQLVSRFRRTYPCSARVYIGKLPQLSRDFQTVVYRLAQECLNNISQHSRAKHVNISVTMADRVLRLRVGDDGVGFHVEEGLGRKQCFGLTGMRERAALLGGSFQIRSSPAPPDTAGKTKNRGTEIDIRLPISGNVP